MGTEKVYDTFNAGRARCKPVAPSRPCGIISIVHTRSCTFVILLRTDFDTGSKFAGKKLECPRPIFFFAYRTRAEMPSSRASREGGTHKYRVPYDSGGGDAGFTNVKHTYVKNLYEIHFAR